jgi:hypothetical protein
MTVEDACRGELAGLPDGVRTSTLAAAALDLARRLDTGPPDREAALLARELRVTVGELRARSGVAAPGDVDAFLARISNPSFLGPGN